MTKDGKDSCYDGLVQVNATDALVKLMRVKARYNMQLFVVLREAGSSWVNGKSSREQPYWDEHAEFMNRIIETGKILLGGPFSDGSGSMVIVKTETEQEARTIFEGDPWLLHNIHQREEVRPWQIFINEFQNL